MKNYTLALLLLLLALGSCSKDSGQTIAKTTVNYDGTYTGNTNAMLNNASIPIQGSIVNISGTSGTSIGIQNTLIVSTAANFLGNTFTIPKHNVTTVLNTVGVEYGTGTFNGSTLVIDLHHDIYNTTDNSVVSLES